MRFPLWFQNLADSVGNFVDTVGRFAPADRSSYREKFEVPLAVVALEERRVLAAPVDLVVAIDPVVAENNSATLSGSFTDVDGGTHSVVVDWGDGANETFALGDGETSFSFSHQYLDDNPTGTIQDNYIVDVTVFDVDGGFDNETTATTIENVDPELTGLTVAPTMVDENGVVTLSGTFTDVGTQDTHSLVIDWGDGNSQTVALAPGATSFDVMHQYLDDDPSGTSQDDYTVSVTLFDDDMGMVVENVKITVKNVAPTITTIGNQEIDVGDTLSPAFLATFVDVGTLDTHTVIIDWGDGSAPQLGALTGSGGSGTIFGSHTFTSEGVFTVTLTLVDDDLGKVAGTFLVGVNRDVIVLPPQDNTPTLGVPGGNFTGGGATERTEDASLVVEPAINPVVANNELNEGRSSGGESSAVQRKRYVLREVSSKGVEGEDVVLADEVLDNLPALYARLEDGHYRIYQIREDGTERLVRNVFLRDHRPYDPNEEGTQDRPPTSQTDSKNGPTLVERPKPIDAEFWRDWSARTGQIKAALAGREGAPPRLADATATPLDLAAANEQVPDPLNADASPDDSATLRLALATGALAAAAPARHRAARLFARASRASLGRTACLARRIRKPK